MVGDPRQVTYHTHEEAKNNKYTEGQIEQFILDKCKDTTVEIDKTSLKTTHRNCKCICAFANSIFPDYEPCDADEKCLTGHALEEPPEQFKPFLVFRRGLVMIPPTLHKLTFRGEFNRV